MLFDEVLKFVIAYFTFGIKWKPCFFLAGEIVRFFFEILLLFFILWYTCGKRLIAFCIII